MLTVLSMKLLPKVLYPSFPREYLESYNNLGELYQKKYNFSHFFYFRFQINTTNM